MGNFCNSQKSDLVESKSLPERYIDAGFTPPFSVDYENNFEKELFYAITLLRMNPSSFVRHVKAAHYKGLIKKSDNSQAAIDWLNSAAPVTNVLKFDNNLIQAVRANNRDICQAAQDEPLKGGNIAKLKEL